MLLAEDGTVFGATIKEVDEGFQAHYFVKLDQRSNVLTESDTRLLLTHQDARNWLDQEAVRRGFKKYGLSDESKHPT